MTTKRWPEYDHPTPTFVLKSAWKQLLEHNSQTTNKNDSQTTNKNDSQTITITLHAKQTKPETKPQEMFENEGPPPIRNVRGEQKQNKTN